MSTRLAMMEENRAKLIEAHRVQDWELARVLSQEREYLKSTRQSRVGSFNHCCVCDQPIIRGIRCQLHYRMHRYYNHSLK